MNRIRIVLVRTSHPGNIGGAARAMKNMGFTNLCLVAPDLFPSKIASARASGAEDILDNARIYSRFDEAIRDCHYVITTTARHRSMQWDNFEARAASIQIIEKTSKGEVAIVFGPEKSGLSNQEIERSHCLIHLPVDESFSSMNLAAAVMLVCYEIRMSAINELEPVTEQPVSERNATAGQVEGFILHLHQVMSQIGFLKNKPSDKLMRRIRRLFIRSRMAERDVNILRGILAGIQSRIK